jgi:DNA repair protein RAD5
VTTYGTLQAELRRKHSMILQCNWLRVILDEAHCIRNHRTLASKVCCQLKAVHRWCVTGTIIQNSLDDLYGIMKFLHHEPWCISSFWNTAITQAGQTMNNNNANNPEYREQSLQTAIERIRRILCPIMIRRTKDSLTNDGVPILTLPPIETKVIKVDMSESEREFYNAVLARSLEVFDGYIRNGTASKAYFQIFSLLSRLRQSCDHIALTVKSKIDDDEWLSLKKPDTTETNTTKSSNNNDTSISKQFLDSLLKKFYTQQGVAINESKRTIDGCETSPKRMKIQEYVSKIANNLSHAIEDNVTYIDEECPICLDRPKIETSILTPCGHIFCRICFLDVVRSQSPVATSNNESNGIAKEVISGCVCPTCQHKFDPNSIIDMSKSSDEHNKDDKKDSSAYASSACPTNHSQNDDSTNSFVLARQTLSKAVCGSESSKMKAIMDELHEIWSLDPGSKVLMFSHYLGFLDLLGAQFNSKNIPYFRLDGSLNVRDRMKVLEEFRSYTNCKQKSTKENIQMGTVLLMSMSAGGEGLNITSASSCFILEPW